MTTDPPPTDAADDIDAAADEDEAGKTARIVRRISGEIDDGIIPIGQRLPGKRALATRFTVAEGTALAALQALAEAGYAVTKGRSGSFARKPKKKRPPVTHDNVLETVATLVQSQAALIEQVKDLASQVAALRDENQQPPHPDA